jgi:hypothetical protein
MAYVLPFVAADGQAWILSGLKDVRGRSIRDFWRATTTLATKLKRGDGGVVADARLRIGVPAVAKLLLSVRARGTGTLARAAVTIARLGYFFGLTITRLYLAGRRGAAPACGRQVLSSARCAHCPARPGQRLDQRGLAGRRSGPRATIARRARARPSERATKRPRRGEEGGRGGLCALGAGLLGLSSASRWSRNRMPSPCRPCCWWRRR